MTKQEIFDKVVNHLLTQKCRSVSNSTACAYRGANGTKCAIGCLIPDEDYKQEFEGVGVWQLYEFSVFQDKLIKSVGANQISSCLYMLSDLQHIHDIEPVEKWEQKLRAIAESYGLEFNYVG